MPEPRAIAEGIENGVHLPPGAGERFSGYGVMGLPFSSGHILALRCFPASSLGMGYRSVWHRNPGGQWTFYQNVPAQQACPRYFGSAVGRAVSVKEIAIVWTGPRDFRVSIEENHRLDWQISLATTLATRLMNFTGRMIPDALWRSPKVLRLMGGVASLTLGAGRLGMTGRVPNGQKFAAAPRRIWMISSSSARLDGEAFGNTEPLQYQERLGDFWIPQRGIFAVGATIFEAYDPARHVLRVSSM